MHDRQLPENCEGNFQFSCVSKVFKDQSQKYKFVVCPTVKCPKSAFEKLFDQLYQESGGCFVLVVFSHFQIKFFVGCLRGDLRNSFNFFNLFSSFFWFILPHEGLYFCDFISQILPPFQSQILAIQIHVTTVYVQRSMVDMSATVHLVLEDRFAQVRYSTY